MIARIFRRWLAMTAAAGVLWAGSPLRASAAAQPQAAVIELKFENLKSPNAFMGFMPDANGKVERPFACASGKLLLEFKSGKLRADSNGDGKIDAKDAPAVELKGDMREPARVEVAVPWAGKTVNYPLFVATSGTVRSGEGQEQTYLLIASGACLEGKYGDATVQIFDGNWDGRFSGSGDRIAISSSARQDPYAGYGVPWSKVVAIAGKLHNIELLNSGSQLKLTPYTGPIAEVRVSTDKSARNFNLMLQGQDEGQIAICRADEATLMVPGKYRIYTLSYQAGDNRRPGFMSGSQDPARPPLEIKAGSQSLKFGPPLKMDITAAFNNGTLDITAVRVAGVSGELYRPDLQKDQGDVFASFIRAGGKETKLAEMEFS